MSVYFYQLKILTTNANIASICPNQSTLKNVLEETAAEIMMIVQRKSKDVAIFVAIFMAIDASNKKGIHHMVKVMAFWDREDDDLFIFEMDSDDCVGSNVATARGVDHLMKKLDKEE